MTERRILDICVCIVDKFGLDVGGMRILFVAAVILGLDLAFVYLFFDVLTKT